MTSSKMALSFPSLMQNAPSILSDDPFPYLVIDNALPDETYNMLSASYPTHLLHGGLGQQENCRVDLVSSWGKSMESVSRIPSLWQNFIEYHSQREFTRQLVGQFGKLWCKNSHKLYHQTRSNIPQFIRAFVPVKNRVAANSIKVRVTIGVNTKSTIPSRVRGPHVDNRQKAFVGLYYLKEENDLTDGGDLCLYRWKDRRKSHPRWPFRADDNEVEIVKTIKYDANKFVLFMNTDNAIHGVTTPAPSKALRRLVVVSGWFPAGVDEMMALADN